MPVTDNSGVLFSGTAAGRFLRVWTTVTPLNTTQTRQKRSLWLEVAALTFSGRKTCSKSAVGVAVVETGQGRRNLPAAVPSEIRPQN